MMNARTTVPLALTFVGLTFVVGCKREDRTFEMGKTTTTTGAVASVSNENAVGRIVASRCAREATCSNIGAGKHFPSSAECTTKLRSDMKDDLNVKDCPYGVDSKELNECLEAIRTEECNNPLDTISRLGACRTTDMCLKTSNANH